MKHTLFLFPTLVLAFAALAQPSPNLPPTRLAPGSGVTITTNGVNNFTIAASGGSSVTNLGNGSNTLLATNLQVYSSGTTNRPLRVFGTNGTTEFYVDKDGTLNLPATTPSTTPMLRVVPANWGLYDGTGGSGGIFFSDNTFVYEVLFNGAGIGISHGTKLWWAAYPNSQGPNTAIERNSSGLVEVNNGTAGQFRDIVVRSAYTTNLYATNLVLNGGATVTGILSATASLNFDLTALTVEDKTITVTGAAVGDVVTLGVPNGSVTTSVQYTAWVSAADTVTVRARTSATGEDPASGTFRATVIKH